MNEPGARPRSLGALEAFIASLPRLAIGIFPTPLVRLDRLSDELGIDLWAQARRAVGPRARTKIPHELGGGDSYR